MEKIVQTSIGHILNHKKSLFSERTLKPSTNASLIIFRGKPDEIDKPRAIDFGKNLDLVLNLVTASRATTYGGGRRRRR